jgi:hypothetical protein
MGKRKTEGNYWLKIQVDDQLFTAFRLSATGNKMETRNEIANANAGLIMWLIFNPYMADGSDNDYENFCNLQRVDQALGREFALAVNQIGQEIKATEHAVKGILYLGGLPINNYGNRPEIVGGLPHVFNTEKAEKLTA